MTPETKPSANQDATCTRSLGEVQAALRTLWTERRTRLLNNAKVYAHERDYVRALRADNEAETLLTALEDVERLIDQPLGRH